jgi:hypothetical protein
MKKLILGLSCLSISLLAAEPAVSSEGTMRSLPRIYWKRGIAKLAIGVVLACASKRCIGIGLRDLNAIYRTRQWSIEGNNRQLTRTPLNIPRLARCGVEVAMPVLGITYLMHAGLSDLQAFPLLRGKLAKLRSNYVKHAHTEGSI